MEFAWSMHFFSFALLFFLFFLFLSLFLLVLNVVHRWYKYSSTTIIEDEREIFFCLFVKENPVWTIVCQSYLVTNKSPMSFLFPLVWWFNSLIIWPSRHLLLLSEKKNRAVGFVDRKRKNGASPGKEWTRQKKKKEKNEDDKAFASSDIFSLVL